MSIAIKTSKGDYIYFDAVLQYSQQYQNAVSKHPVDGGANISDHITMENPTFTINGLISGADFNSTRTSSENTSTSGSITFKNQNPIPSLTHVTSSEKSLLDSVPFLSGLTSSPPAPEIEMSASSSISLEIIREALVALRDNAANANSNYGLFSIIEFDGGVISRAPRDNCVLTNITFNESPETGDCLDVNLSIEQVTFVTLQKTQLATKTNSSSVKDKATTEQSKGAQGTTPSPTPPDADVSSLKKLANKARTAVLNSLNKGG